MTRHKMTVVVSSTAFAAAGAATGILNSFALRPVTASWAAGSPGIDPMRVVRASSGIYALAVTFFAAAAVIVWLAARPAVAIARGGAAKNMLWGLGGGIGGGILSVVLVPQGSGVRAVVGYWISHHTEAGALISLVLGALIAPAAGELAFRGVFQEMTIGSVGPALSLFSTAVLYAFVWPLPGSWLATFSVGAFAGLAYLKTRGVLAPMIASTIAFWEVIASIAVFGPHWPH